jgi:hypothetical protein
VMTCTPVGSLPPAAMARPGSSQRVARRRCISNAATLLSPSRF